jgi:hypothetical protein
MVGELPMRKEFRETAVKYARHAHMVGLDERIMSQVSAQTMKRFPR